MFYQAFDANRNRLSLLWFLKRIHRKIYGKFCFLSSEKWRWERICSFFSRPKNGVSLFPYLRVFVRLKPHQKGSFREQIAFTQELYREKNSILCFLENRIFLCFIFKKSIILLSDLVSYFYPEKELKWTWMRHFHTFILRQAYENQLALLLSVKF